MTATLHGRADPQALGRPHIDAADARLLLGEILIRAGRLDPVDIDPVLAHQRANGLRFGEAAVALGRVSEEDVFYALAQQFQYPYVPGGSNVLDPELVIAIDPYSRQAEAFRAIRAQLTSGVLAENASASALAVVSPDHGDGKTFFAANIAIALAQLGMRTLLVDADLRNPRLHALFGLSSDAGLADILSGRAHGPIASAVPHLPGLSVLPVGTIPPNPTELLERPPFERLLAQWAGEYRYVVIDTSASSVGVDSKVVAQKCGAALCLARKDHSRVKRLEELGAALASSDVRVAGVVLNEYRSPAFGQRASARTASR